MLKSTSDKSFFDFLKSKNTGTAVIILAIGLALLLISGLFSDSDVKNEEDRVEEACAMVEGVGECRVIMTYRDDRVYAVAILCEGAESLSVKDDLTSLVCSLYGIGANRVKILPLDDGDKS